MDDSVAGANVLKTAQLWRDWVNRQGDATGRKSSSWFSTDAPDESVSII
jgi:hypothetical protein